MKAYKIPQVKITYVADSSVCKPQIKTSYELADIIAGSFEDGEIGYQEHFKIVYLNRMNKVIGIHTISIGGTSSTIVDLKVIFTGALLANASSIALAHNHPSGNLNPSPQDDNLTKKVYDASRLMDITLLDHIIVTENGYYSYKDEGKL